MGNVKWEISADGLVAEGTLLDGSKVLVDADILPLICNKTFYRGGRKWSPYGYVMTEELEPLHGFVLPHRPGYEVDHINLNTLDNRRENLRYVTHQQNQINQPLQKNNTSGVSGVNYYKPRGKYRARIKVSQRDIHLGYYDSFEVAVQARNVGMECMFGEYGRYNNAPPAPNWVKEKVIGICKRFAHLSVCEAFSSLYGQEAAS